MLARPRKWRRSEIEVLGEPGVIGGYAEPQNIFFRFLRLCLSRETYIAMEECMVEAAGVEPHGAVHLFASPCAYRSLSASNDIFKIGGNASKCREFGK